MNIGMVGLGKLGFPVAVAISSRGHEVWGYDSSPGKRLALRAGNHPVREQSLADYWERCKGRVHIVDDPLEVVINADLIFIAVQTPHAPEFDGTHPGKTSGPDFDYSHLISAVSSLRKSIDMQDQPKTLCIISTVLPGTMRSLLAPFAAGNCELVYNPAFVAMGRVIRDYFNPEFVILGSSDRQVSNKVPEFYSTITHSLISRYLSWEEAEAVKVFYNTFIGLKIVFTNTVMQICDAIGADSDQVMGALQLASYRLTSPVYLNPGLGDGGPCHPRDNIALSSLSRQLKLPYDLFETIMRIREHHARWIASIMCQHDLPKVILGQAYKSDVNLTDGSPSLLVAAFLVERGQRVTFYDVFTQSKLPDKVPSVYLIGVPMQEYYQFPFAENSVVVNPWGRFPTSRTDLTIITPGRHRESY